MIVASGILFARFPSVECISNNSSLLVFIASTVNDVRRKLHMVKTHLTVRKRARRMPDATVEATKGLTYFGYQPPKETTKMY